jgi:hypothetical protein
MKRFLEQEGLGEAPKRARDRLKTHPLYKELLAHVV